MVRLGGFVRRLLGSLLKTGLLLMANALEPWPKRFLVPIRFIVVATAKDSLSERFKRKLFGPACVIQT